MVYRFKDRFTVDELCRLLNVSRSGYYKWLKHEKTDEEKENEQIAQLVGEYDFLLFHADFGVQI